MQLKNLQAGWAPITIAAGIISVASPLYADIDQFSKIEIVVNSQDTAKYLEEVNNENEIYLNDSILFKTHLVAWESETLFMSSIQSIVDHQDFKAIIAMGKRAVPFILEEISIKPSNLVWALNIIFKKKITNRANTTIEEACKLWVKAMKS
jgi:hypothetical protein